MRLSSENILLEPITKGPYTASLKMLYIYNMQFENQSNDLTWEI